MQVHGNIGSGHHQTSGDETSGKQSQQQKSHQKDKHQGSTSYKILWTILKMDKGGTQRNGPKDKEIDDYAQDLKSKR